MYKRFAIICAFLWGAVAVVGQEPTGTIAGTITDTSGAVIPNAVVTVINKSTGAQFALMPRNVVAERRKAL